MTGWLWALTAVFIVAAFLLGGVTFRRWPRRQHRLQNALGVFYAVIGIVAIMDLLHVNHRIGHEVRCNQMQNEALIAIGDARRNVDTAALAYDEKLTAFFASPISEREPDDKVATEVRASLDKLVAARKVAVDVSTRNPFPDCDH